MVRVLSKVFQRWYLYLPLLLIIPALVTLYAKDQLTVYASSAYVYVQAPVTPDGQSSEFNQYLTPAQNGANAMIEQMGSAKFVLAVANATDLKKYDLSNIQTAQTIVGRVQSEVTITPSTVGQNALTVTVQDKNPHLAQQIAAAVIQQFIAYYMQHEVALDKQQESILTAQLQSIKAQVAQDIARVSQYEQAHPGVNTQQTTDPQLAQLEQQLTQDQATQTTLSQKLRVYQDDETAATSGVSSIFQVQDQPQVPISPTLQKKKLLVYTGGGLAGALVLIALLAFIEARVDRKVYSSQDLRSITDSLEIEAPTIEAIPLLHTIGKRSGRGDDADSEFSGVLVPVLTALPHLGSGEMTQELRRVAGVKDKA